MVACFAATDDHRRADLGMNNHNLAIRHRSRKPLKETDTQRATELEWLSVREPQKKDAANSE
jgi:hypothetical protein